MEKKIISQSFIKSIFKYKSEKMCGLQFKAQYVDGIEFPSGDVQRLGQWFEYVATGQKTKFGHIPEPDRLKPKKLTQKEIKEGLKQEDVQGGLSKKYKDILVQVEMFKKMLDFYDYEIVETGKTIINMDLGISGDVDLVVRKRGEEEVKFIDLKTSGLLDNKWDDMGWGDDGLEFKDNLMIQAVQYKILGLSAYGYEPEFYFWVFSNTNTIDRKNIKVEVGQEKFEEHMGIITKARYLFHEYEKNGWKARPTVKDCAKCAIKASCQHFIDIPAEQVVNYGIQA
jgi:hypothetical protein